TKAESIVSAHGTRGSGMTWVGRAVRRLEDPALVTGQGHFSADAPAAHWVRFVRSPVAAGKLANIKAPKGAMVITAADLTGVKKMPSHVPQIFLRAGGQTSAGRRLRPLRGRTSCRCGGGNRGRGRGHFRSGRAVDRHGTSRKRRTYSASQECAANTPRSARQ